MGIISKAESMQILEWTLREQGREKYVAQLSTATADEKRKILSEIEKDVQRELRKHMDFDVGIH